MLSKNNFFLFVLFFIVASGITSCLNDKDKNIPDVSDIEVSLTINRFEQDLFAIDTSQVAEGIAELEEKYPEFTDFYLTRALQVKKPWDTTGAYREYVRGFLTFPFVKELAQKVDSVYGDFRPIEKELTQGFQFYKYYFPEKTVPEFYTFISEFTYGIVLPPEDNTMAVGLDLFLGKDFEYYAYPPLSLPHYVIRTQDAQHLPSKIFKGIIEDLAGPVKGNRFIDHIIHNGKKLYVLDHLLPYQSDSVKLGFTEEQLAWCEANELEIWGYFLKEKMMFSDNFQNFKSLVNPAPRSDGMPETAPGEVGNWVGWQIVKAFMRRNPEVTLPQLVAMEDVQNILAKAKYKPSS
ncbi:MAG: hypothetical protein AAF960_26680 [Bacteroidota bacterium]